MFHPPSKTPNLKKRRYKCGAPLGPHALRREFCFVSLNSFRARGSNAQDVLLLDTCGLKAIGFSAHSWLFVKCTFLRRWVSHEIMFAFLFSMYLACFERAVVCGRGDLRNCVFERLWGEKAGFASSLLIAHTEHCQSDRSRPEL